jgi:ADP-ribose pyrophosphatase
MRPSRRLTAYEGALFDVVIEDWDGREREVVEHPGSTAVVAVDAEGSVYLVRQTREAARGRVLELPAGTLEEGEDPLESAQRELEEEVGLVGGVWSELAVVYTSPGFCNERMYIFLAEDVEAGGERDLDDDEDVEVVTWSADDIEANLDEIEDAKTLAGLLLYLRLR